MAGLIHESQPFVHTREKVSSEPIDQNTHKKPIQNLTELKSHGIILSPIQSHESPSRLSQVQKDGLTAKVSENDTNILETVTYCDAESSEFCCETTWAPMAHS
jgi:hypothetical protein